MYDQFCNNAARITHHTPLGLLSEAKLFRAGTEERSK